MIRFRKNAWRFVEPHFLHDHSWCRNRAVIKLVTYNGRLNNGSNVEKCNQLVQTF